MAKNYPKTYYPSPGQPASRATIDPWARLAAAVIAQAVQDAKAGSIEAQGWLIGSDCAGWLIILGFDTRAVRRWVDRRQKINLRGDKMANQKIEIIRYDPEVAQAWEKLQNRRRELSARLGVVNSELAKSKNDMGRCLAEGGDYSGFAGRLWDLRLEAEALDAAVSHIDRQAESMRRSNSWLAVR